MGSIGARKLNQVVGNLEQILGIELLCASQAFEFRKPLYSGPVLEEVFRFVREHVEFATEDRIFGEDIRIVSDLISNKEVLNVANSAAKQNDINLIDHDLFGIY